MIQSLKNIWNIPELRRRVLYTLGLLAVYRIGGHIPTPGIDNAALVRHPGITFDLMTVLTLTTGTAFIMWLGEQISERGIGNGISLIIYAGIVVGFPNAVAKTIQDWSTGALSPLVIALLVILMVLVV